jgi:hypothetical protein
MRILLTTEREEAEVNVSQAHKEAQVGYNNDLVLRGTEVNNGALWGRAL